MATEMEITEVFADDDDDRDDTSTSSTSWITTTPPLSPTSPCPLEFPIPEEFQNLTKLDPEVTRLFHEGTDSFVDYLGKVGASVCKDYKLINIAYHRSTRQRQDKLKQIKIDRQALRKIAAIVSASKKRKLSLSPNSCQVQAKKLHSDHDANIEEPVAVIGPHVRNLNPLLNPCSVKALRTVLGFLDTKSLKRCRSVCQHWNQHASPILNRIRASLFKSQRSTGRAKGLHSVQGLRSIL